MNVTLLMIIVLNFLGTPSDDEPTVDAREQTWFDEAEQVSKVLFSLDDVSLICEQKQCLAELTGAHQLWVAFLVDGDLGNPDQVPVDLILDLNRLGGQTIVTSRLSIDRDLSRWMAFFESWLPKNSDITLLLVGATEARWTQPVINKRWQFLGDAIEPKFANENALKQVLAPPFAQADYLAFRLWVSVLQARVKDASAIRWQHEYSPSRVSLQTEFLPELFDEVTAGELAPVLDYFQSLSIPEQLSGDEVRRYAINSLVYDVPLSYFLTRQARLAAVNLRDVNRMRESFFEQIQKP